MTVNSSAKDRSGRSRETRIVDGKKRNVWAKEHHAESEVSLGSLDSLDASDGLAGLDALDEDAIRALSAEHPEHDLAHLGIYTITLPDGRVVAHNSRGGTVPCPVCEGVPSVQATCAECVGRGVVNDIPFCDRPWDVVHITEAGGRVYLGGHDNQPAGGSAVPGDQFDLVVSLYRRYGYDPADGTPHLIHLMIDGDLHPDDHPHIHRLADAVAEAAERGEQVLVRCQAGMNRSGLVAGLALVKMGRRAEEVIEHMRRERSPYVLFNTSFVDFIRANDPRHRTKRTA